MKLGSSRPNSKDRKAVANALSGNFSIIYNNDRRNLRLAEETRRKIRLASLLSMASSRFSVSESEEAAVALAGLSCFSALSLSFFEVSSASTS